MTNSLNHINEVRNKDYSCLKNEVWLKYLYVTRENNYNLEQIQSIKELESSNQVFDYVQRTLMILHVLKDGLREKEFMYVEETLKWSEVAKCGLPHQRELWMKQGINLFVHNVGSSQIYSMQHGGNGFVEDTKDRHIINTLIKSHGLIGQYIRGEVNLSENMPLTNLITFGYITKESLKRVLYILNKCIITSVSYKLWESLKIEVSQIIDTIMEGNYQKNEYFVAERIRRLRSKTIKKGENFEEEYSKIVSSEVKDVFNHIFAKANLWYVEAALADFRLEEFVKILMLTYKAVNPLTIEHLSFDMLMKEVYYDHNEVKTLNLYKQRIIETYLRELSIDDILAGHIPENPHIRYMAITSGEFQNTVRVTFQFSSVAQKLIEFCQEAEKSKSPMYQKAIYMLFEMLGFRRDQYDRFYNEDSYLATMNQSLGYKTVISEYIPDNVEGHTVIDVGPGGGALMDHILEEHPDMKVIGVDISENVIEKLGQIKTAQNKKWDFIKGDARRLNELHKTSTELKEILKPGSVAAVSFCSIIHEIYSYNNFSYEAIKEALQAAFDLLCIGGRIIVRDGIKTEPEAQDRVITFKTPDGMPFLERYAADFKGREIKYSVVGENKVKMSVNDAMEFLYTFTWGEESYSCEINEQFGYFTPSEYLEFISDVLGEKAKVTNFKHYLQDGYEGHLLPKIDFTDEEGNVIKLPDSTAVIVIEKLQ